MTEDNCHVEPIHKQPSIQERSQEQSTRLAIRGMRCPTCALRVRNSLLGLEGVLDAEVSHIMGSANVHFNPNMIGLGQLSRAVKAAGGDGRHEYSAHIML